VYIQTDGYLKKRQSNFVPVLAAAGNGRVSQQGMEIGRKVAAE